MKHVAPEWFKQPSEFGRADMFEDGKDRYVANLTTLLRPVFIKHGGSEANRTSDCTITPGLSNYTGVHHAVPTHCLSWFLYLFGWTCEDNCRYNCMIENHMVRRANGENTVRYYGKWPFKRIFGMQEVLSSLFSLLNGVPHGYFLLSGAPWSYPCKGQRDTLLWIIYATVYVNTWLQSTLFHARDTKLFEILDYHSATLGLAMSLASGIAMNMPAHWAMSSAMCLALAPVVGFWGVHISYLTFFSFDYGHNMVVAVILGGSAMIAWILWFVRHGWEECRPFLHKVPLAILGPAIVLPLELWDFPPLLGLLDAHAVWHFGTIPVNFLIYECLMAKMRHTARSVGGKAE
eukprot:gnl/TRDRNA2_/TRDRNA2_172778_c1_seq1.p1 gnl/TRDRNA2_/TRDRNA2_172778_c1~~gnl/TRDRNA2_/TRDRNA2_172778_c1_seq1.p1  ORF type:complete len:376 (-),score=27.70 gnl/TRDRNA2_/TRDRNA2_172778_c1_seq1:118-1158(-)